MNYRDILVHVVEDDARRSHVLATATELARRWEARLDGLYVEPPDELPALIDAPLPPAVLESLEVSRRERRAAAEAAWDEAVQGLDTSFTAVPGDAVRSLAAHARRHDLVILAQTDDRQNGPGDDEVTGGALVAAGRPALIVPYIGASTPPGGRVMVAWDGSREAARALHDALPLLGAATRVELVRVNPARERVADGDTIGDHLVRHGISAEVHDLVYDHLDVGDALLSHAADSGADLIVMGAYGHSRLREFVLGGATRHLLAHMTVPVLMSH